MIEKIRPTQLPAILTLVLLIVMSDGIITQGEHEVVTEIFKCANLSDSTIEEIVRRVEIDTGFKINMNLSRKAG